MSKTNKKFSDDVERILSRSASYSSINRSPGTVCRTGKESSMEDLGEENCSQSSDEIDLEEVSEEVKAMLREDEELNGNSGEDSESEKKDV